MHSDGVVVACPAAISPERLSIGLARESIAVFVCVCVCMTYLICAVMLMMLGCRKWQAHVTYSYLFRLTNVGVFKELFASVSRTFDVEL